MPSSSSLFGNLLVSARSQRGLSCNRLALLANVDQATLSKVERGQRRPTDEMLKKLAPAMGMPFEELKAWADVDRLGPDGLERLLRYLPETGLQSHVLRIFARITKLPEVDQERFLHLIEAQIERLRGETVAPPETEP